MDESRSVYAVVLFHKSALIENMLLKEVYGVFEDSEDATACANFYRDAAVYMVPLIRPGEIRYG